jgi:hypothetical protein
MSKRSPSGPLAAFVDPVDSVDPVDRVPTSHQKTSEEKDPPPPQAGEFDSKLLERAERARAGSRRQRDLDALATVMRAQRGSVEASPQAVAVWDQVLEGLRGRVSASAFDSWLEPVACIGTIENAIAVEAPERVMSWLTRRYASFLGESIRAASDFAGLRIFPALPTASDPTERTH